MGAGPVGLVGKSGDLVTRVFVPLEQNSDQWQEWRAGVRSASDAPVIMGAAPSYWEKRTWDDLRNPPEREVSEFTQRLWDMGHRRERWYRQAHGLPIEPACLQRGEYAASLDGFFEGLGDSWWEIKSVRSGSSRMWTRFPVGMHYREVREHMLAELAHVWWQLVHQAHVVGSGTCFFVAIGPKQRILEKAIPAPILLQDWPALREQWELWAGGGQPGQSDDAWLTAAREYLAAKEAHEEATERLKKARATALALASETDHPEGGGIKVVTSTRVGTVDWRTAARDRGVDDELAEKYRRPDFEVTSIRRSG